MYSGIHCAVLANTIGRGEPGVCELSSEQEIQSYICNPLPEMNSSFAITYGDFNANFGEEYEFYRPETLFSGSFVPSVSAAQ